MVVQRAFILIVVGLAAMGLGATVYAGDWGDAPIEDLGGLLNARTDLKDSAAMELGSKNRTDGHPAAWGEIEVECAGTATAKDQWCNIQLEVVFTRPNPEERFKIEILDGEEQPIKTVYLLKQTNDDVRARVYFVGVEHVDGVNPTVRVAIKGDGNPIKGNARVTFLRAKVEKEDKTNWQVASNWPLCDRTGRPLKRPTFLFLQ